MTKSDVAELYYICPIRNLVSICQLGILSHNKAKKVKPKSVADPIIQERREGVAVPGIYTKLHDYANLYLNPRNAMMYKIRAMHEELCLIGVSPEILEEKDVLITDGNASSSYRRFYPSPWGLMYLEKDLVFSRDWRHSDTYEYWRRKRCVCAEVLVPKLIPVGFIQRIYVSCAETTRKMETVLSKQSISIEIVKNSDLFFQSL